MGGVATTDGSAIRKRCRDDDRGDGVAVLERSQTNRLERVRQGHGRKRRAVLERVLTDAGHRIRHDNRNKVGAVLERIIANRGHAVRKLKGLDIGIPLEHAAGDADNRVAVELLRDDQRTHVAVVLGDGRLIQIVECVLVDGVRLIRAA